MQASPNRDPVFLVLIAVAVIILAFTGWTAARPWLAVAAKHCPAPDHAMWAPSIGQAICGTGPHFGFKAVKAK